MPSWLKLFQWASFTFLRQLLNSSPSSFSFWLSLLSPFWKTPSQRSKIGPFFLLALQTSCPESVLYNFPRLIHSDNSFPASVSALWDDVYIAETAEQGLFKCCNKSKSEKKLLPFDCFIASIELNVHQYWLCPIFAINNIFVTYCID